MAGRPFLIEMVANVDAGHFSGSTTHVFEMATNLARRNQVRLWLSGQAPARSEAWGGFEVRLYGSRRNEGRRPRFVRALLNEASLLAGLLTSVRRRRPDAIYVRETYTLAPGIVARLFGIPLLIEVNVPVLYAARSRHRGLALRLRSAVLKLHARMASLILPITELQVRYVVAGYGVPADRVRVMPNGANLSLFRPEDRDEARRTLGLDAGLEYILWAGSVRRIADLGVLLDAVARLSAPRPLIRLLFLSATGETLAGEVERRGLSGRVLLHSIPYGEVHTYYAAADVTLATWEDSENTRVNGASPLKVYEYMGSARPVVAARLPDLAFVERERLGRLYHPGDAGSLARAVEGMLEMDPARRREMGLRARAYVEERHDWAKTAVMVEGAIRGLSA